MTAKEAADSIKRYAEALSLLKRAKIAREVIAPDLRSLACEVRRSPESQWHSHPESEWLSRPEAGRQSVCDALDFLLWRVPFGHVLHYGRFDPHHPEKDRDIIALTLPLWAMEGLIKTDAWWAILRRARAYKGTDHEDLAFSWYPPDDWVRQR